MISARSLKKEELLVISYQKNQCNKAFGELYEMFYCQLFDYVCKIVNTKDDAFDITQETFIVAAREIKNLRTPVTFRFWLFKVAKNLCMKTLRSESRYTFELYEADIISEDYSGIEAIQKNDLHEQVTTALSKLSNQDQNLLISKYCLGNSIKEIMETTNLGGSAIKMKLMRAKSKISEEIARNCIKS